MVARVLRRNRRWIELVLGFAVLVWLGLQILEREVVAEPELLIDKFRVTVFSTDVGPRKYEPRDSVSKWNGPVRLGLHGNAARYRDVIDRIAGELTRLTGLSVGVVDLGNSEPPNFHIYFADPDKTLDLLLRFKEDPMAAREMHRSLCMASGSTESSPFTGGMPSSRTVLAGAKPGDACWRRSPSLWDLRRTPSWSSRRSSATMGHMWTNFP